uniref:Uncharacterized protein n=1 Tax=Panagrolaimus davidi TaxID=227884 RepID=A0A914QKG8_9BILA
MNLTIRAKRVPSTKDIEDYDDPVLREIFKKNVPPNPELLANNGYQQQYYNQNGYQAGGGQLQPYSQGNGYYPQSNTQQRYQSQPSFSNSNSNQGNAYIQQYANSESGQAFGNLAATGAQNFYNGAQTVSNAFGLPQYESPLISSAASLFGKRRRR